PAPEEITVKYRRKNLTRLLREMKERGITIEAIEANIRHKGVGATEDELNWAQPQLTRVRTHFGTMPSTRRESLMYSRSAALGNGAPLPRGFDLFGHWKPPVSTQRAPASPEPEPEPEPEDDDTGELGEALMQALREAATQHEPEPLPGVLTPWNNTVAPAPTTDRRAAALALIGDETLNEILKEHLAKVCDELEALSVRRGELEDEKATTELALEAFE
ncbi:MAG TPA: hypothetical protein VFH61_11090, partial [Thermoleophilia bacterium]|nr:hypothetical protein [Thermoleophilia bacterium]